MKKQKGRGIHDKLPSSLPDEKTKTIGNETKPAHAEAILTTQCYKTITETAQKALQKVNRYLLSLI